MGFRAAREKSGLSVAEVSKALNVSDAAIYSWETNAYLPKTEKLPEIAKLYGCTVDELLRKDEP